MTSEPLIERETVRTEAGLQELCRDLHAAGRFALDTEFVGERTYIPRLCLVQVATETFIALVDTLTIQDLSPLWALVADPTIEKVLHAAREDLRLAYYGGERLIPRNIFDTQVAAGLVGLPMYPLSYARLVEALAGVRLSKAETRSEWDRRPLSPDQLRYARDDVRYLLDIASKLSRLLKTLGRTQWVEEEMARFSEPLTYEPEPDLAYLRLRGSRSGMTARVTAMLRSVAAWREREAAARNVPARTLVRDEILMELAQRPPRRMTDFARVRGFPEGDETTLGPDILDALNQARQLSEEDLPPPLAGGDEETSAERILGDLIYALAASLCLAKDIAPELAVSKTSALDLVMGRDRSVLMSGWRREVLGEALSGLVGGNGIAQIQVSNKKPLITFEARQ